MDPSNYITKPFDQNIKYMASELITYCNLYKQLLKLDGLNLSKPLHSCTALIYSAGKYIKKTNNKISSWPQVQSRGKFIQSTNSQVKNNNYYIEVC